jgi:DNA-binding NarL/FixJ family response regulator
MSIVDTGVLRLLLADDHRMLREALRRSLEDEGVEVVGEAGDGEEAVHLAGQLLPDVVLMDVTMPNINGIEATRRIRELHPEVRVVVLTMHGDPDTQTQAIRAGASGFLGKDCPMEEVLSAVRLAAGGDAVLSRNVAVSMLDEVHRLGHREEDPVVTKREEEVLQLIADGLSTPEVAAALYISVKTVKNHLASIYQKLDSRDRTQAVLRAVRMGIIRLD